MRYGAAVVGAMALGLASGLGGSSAFAAPGPAACGARVNDTPEKLLECIQQPVLWAELQVFQRIADAHPDPLGHGNRNTGTAGYRASVAHVAAVMRAAGYRVTVQPYDWTDVDVVGRPALTLNGRALGDGDFSVPRFSGSGQARGLVVRAGDGCAAGNFAAMPRGAVVALSAGACGADAAVANAARAGAAAVLIAQPDQGKAMRVRLTRPAAIAVLCVGEMPAAGATAAVDVHTRGHSRIDYNLIADSRFGDPSHVVVIEGHLDAIFGAGMLDNASGSTTIMDVARNLASTPTVNQLRYVWFGGEEIGLLGSAYYTTHLSAAERARIAFDMDVDVTATPNYDVLVADPRQAPNASAFPPNVVPQSAVGNRLFYGYFATAHIPVAPAWFGNEGTDSNSFSLIGIPNTGLLTQQDCCKTGEEVAIWGGVQGNYEGNIPSFDGGCVDNARRWCDNLSNNNPVVFAAMSKAVGFVTLRLAMDRGLGK